MASSGPRLCRRGTSAWQSGPVPGQHWKRGSRGQCDSVDNMEAIRDGGRRGQRGGTTETEGGQDRLRQTSWE